MIATLFPIRGTNFDNIFSEVNGSAVLSWGGRNDV